MEIYELKAELKELRRLNATINSRIDAHEKYTSRLSYLEQVGMVDSNEYKAVKRNMDKINAVDLIRREAELESKYIDYFNNLSQLKRSIAIDWYIKAKPIYKIQSAYTIDRDSVYVRLTEIRMEIFRKVGLDSKELNVRAMK